MNKKTLMQLLAKGKTLMVMSQLERELSNFDEDKQAEIIHVAGQYRGFLQKRRLGLLYQDQESVELARINRSIQEIVSELSYEKQSKKKNTKKFVISLTILLCVLSIIFINVSVTENSVFSRFFNQKTVKGNIEYDFSNKRFNEKFPPMELQKFEKLDDKPNNNKPTPSAKKPGKIIPIIRQETSGDKSPAIVNQNGENVIINYDSWVGKNDDL